MTDSTYTQNTLSHDNLELMLSALSLKGFKEHCWELAKVHEQTGKTHIDFLNALAVIEIERRSNERLLKILQNAKLPRNKILCDFDIKCIKGLSGALIQQLSNGSFMDSGSNIIIMGNPGTGKTHLSIGLAREWCLLGRKVLFLTAAKLLEDLKIAHADRKFHHYLSKLDRFECLIIDDISYVPMEREDADLLFQLISERYEKRSLLITSNVPFSKWGSIFKDDMTTAAAVDRLVHHAEILELNAKSYRVKKAFKKMEQSEELKKQKTDDQEVKNDVT